MSDNTKTPDGFHAQSGIALLEALVAILIFSIGILALVGLQATAIKQSTDARYRAEAAALANELIGQMWLVNRTDASQTTANLKNNFATDGPEYDKWAARVLATLPGNIPPTVSVDESGTALPGRVFITIQWKAPSEQADAPAHTYLVTTMIQ